MSRSFYNFNPYNSESLTEVKHFTTAFVNHDSDFTTPYYGSNDDKFLDEWPYEPFNYTFNKYGFRYTPLVEQADIGAFGCSYTFGQSMPQDKLWHSLLSKETGLTSLNFGVAGASIQSIVDIFSVVCKHIKMKKVIFLLPHYSRYQMAISKKNDIGYENITSHNKEHEFFYKAMPIEELQKQAKNALYRAEHIAKLEKIEIFFGIYQSDVGALLRSMNFKYATILPDWTAILGDPTLDLARDKHHPGPMHHKQWVDAILPFIKQNN